MPIVTYHPNEGIIDNDQFIQGTLSNNVFYDGNNSELEPNRLKYYCAPANDGRSIIYQWNGTTYVQNMTLVLPWNSDTTIDTLEKFNLYSMKRTTDFFLGWYLDSSFTQRATPGPLTENIDLYAKYQDSTNRSIRILFRQDPEDTLWT